MRQRHQTIYRMVLGVTLATLVGCGWQLRGSGDMASNIDSLHISARDLSGDFVTDLRRNLKASKVKLVENAPEASYSLVILAHRSDRRTASIAASARAAEYELTEEVDFLVLAADGKQLMAPTTVRSERVVDFNEDDVLAHDNETRAVKQNMRNDLIRQIVYRLQAMGQNTSNAP